MAELVDSGSVGQKNPITVEANHLRWSPITGSSPVLTTNRIYITMVPAPHIRWGPHIKILYMNYIDYHVVSTSVIVGLGLMFFVVVTSAVLIAIGHYFGGNDDDEFI